MKSKILIILIIFVIFLGISAVSACDNQSEVIGNDYRTFTDLKHDLSNCSEVFEVQNDYKFSDSDNQSQIQISKSKLTINGNNHTIDASYKNVRLLLLNYEDISNETRIVINDLNFVNFNGSAISSLSNNIELNNVNFSNIINGAAVFGNNYDLTVNNCNFNSNNAIYVIGAADYSNLKINNSFFTNNTASVSVISNDRGNLIIENTIFENLVSNYGGAVNYKGDYISIKKSKFINITANKTGGAIILKFFPRYNDTTKEYLKSDSYLIEECVFANISSKNNGGVILCDLSSRLDNKSKTLNIYNTNFTNSHSKFGGAIVSAGGFLNISNSNFNNISADKKGGVIYISSSNLTIDNVNMSNNNAGEDAGAIYFDLGQLNILNSYLINNTSPGLSNAVYVHEAFLNIENSSFKNGGVGLYADFIKNSKIVNINSTDSFSLNNTYYVVSVENNGIKLNLTNNTIIVDKLPSKFDYRDWGWVTSVKNQGDANSCWAFSTTAAIESSLLKSTGVSYDLSENNIKALQMKYFQQGDNRNPEIGFAYSGLGYALSWYGLVMEDSDEYDGRSIISDVIQTDERIHLQDALFVFGGRNDTEKLIKEALIKYGAFSIQFKPDTSGSYTGNFYTNESDVQPTHFVTLIGYDDNYPVSKFMNSPSRPGAWIIKNSWGPSLGNNGYGYISYDDTSFLAWDKNAIVPQNAAVCYIFENDENYHVNYQTDLTGLTGFDGNYTVYSNEFTSKYSELISAVGTYFNDSGINYSFDIYVNNNLIHSQNGTSEFAGFRTIKLTSDVPVKANDTFKVVFKNNALPYQAYSRQQYIQNMSFVSRDGETFTDITLENKTVCLKVYTKAVDIFTKDLVKIYKNDSKFEASVGAANATVTFEVNGGAYNRTADENGIAKIAINLLPGNYTIKTTFNGTSVENNIEVLPTLIGENLVKYFRNASQFDISLIDGYGNAVPDVIITMNINGVFYNRTTNEKGTARLNINLAPGEYILTAIDPLTGLMMSYNITVLSVLNATDIEMIYKDGTQFKTSLIDGTGSPLAGVNIIFNINGVFYNRTTDENGTALLNINLMAGEYIITSQYENAVISNTITIRD